MSNTKNKLKMTEEFQLASRLVHLDLKGAPLNLMYLEKILPLLKNWGATGLLIEYEDTFPYQHELKQLCGPHAYSKEDVRQILRLAEECNLEVIPLVQTFGHLEFVLKHKEFAHVREVKNYPMAICPSNPDSLSLVCKMVDQILELHPQIKHLHIGCDEVYHLGMCEVCQLRMAQESVTKDQLFIAHVKSVATHIKTCFQDMTIIIWDDMLRCFELPIILNCGLNNLVEPMVWHYLSRFMLPGDIWDNLSAVFSNVWIASAFKGATGCRASVTNIPYHLENTTNWVDTVKSVRNKFKHVKGVALTGWQRYDHFAILCELFPQGLPSLALCLKAFQQGNLGAEDLILVANELKFTSSIPLIPYPRSDIPECNFPGSEIYQLTIDFVHSEAAFKELFASDGMATWMHEHNMERGFINPVHVEPLLGRAISILDSFHLLDKKVQATFKHVFVRGVEEEWRAFFIIPYIKRLETFVDKAQSFFGAVM